MAQFKLPSFLLTTWLLLLLGMAVTKSGAEHFLRRLGDYQIVYPKVLTVDDARIKRSIYEERNKIENSDQKKILYIEINNWILHTFDNNRFILSPNFTAEWLFNNYTNDTIYHPSVECSYRYGSLDSDEESLVVVTICEKDFYALIMLDGRSYLVQPLDGDKHIMYETKPEEVKAAVQGSVLSVRTGSNVETSMRKKRSPSTEQPPEYYNLSGDVFDLQHPEVEKFILYDDTEVIDEGEPVEEEASSNQTDSTLIDYFSGFEKSNNKLTRRKPVKGTSPRWLELGIAADYSVIEFHGTRVQQYILAVLNIVSAIYMDPSLESNMLLVVVRMILYAEKRDGMVRRGDARRSLENVNKWNRKMLALSDVKHDIGVWLTRLDIGGPSGYAPVSGVCNPARSCALNRDEGLTSAFIIAHEVAHILGLTHDGDKETGNTCTEEAKRGSVMAPMVAATFHHFYWSDCSKKEFHRTVRRWSCLLNEPRQRSFTQLKARFKETFTMDEQCRMEFGEGYELCKTFNVLEPCSHLWCGNINISRTCKTKKGPPLDGTVCGEFKWCISGRCRLTDGKKLNLEASPNKPRDGGWSVWSPWEKCSRTCGTAVQCRSRKCNKPQPAYGGKYCSGPHEDCRLCRLAECSTPVDLRRQQCLRLAGTNSSWLPYEMSQENLKCQLICINKETGEIMYTGQSMMDGTPCSYGSTDICIRGECYKMGCDNVLGSPKVADICGVCDGDSSNCESISSKFQRMLRREITRIAIIPREAHNLLMNITIPDGGFSRNNLSVVVGDGRKRRNVEESLVSRMRDIAIIQGALFRIQESSNNTMIVKQIGSMFEDVVILVVIPEESVKAGISISVSLMYSVNHLEMNARSRYVWTFGGWSFCSASCGGGIRYKTKLCKDEKTGRVVSRRKCSRMAKPVHETEVCNTFSCRFKWLPSSWEACSASCGGFGIQLRQLFCMHIDFNETEVNKANELEVYRSMLRPSACHDIPKLSISRECNRIPCPGHWIFTDWSSIKIN